MIPAANAFVSAFTSKMLRSVMLSFGFLILVHQARGGGAVASVDTKLEFDEKIHVWLYCPSTAPIPLIAFAIAEGATGLAEISGIALKLLHLISPYSTFKLGATHLKAVSVTAIFMAS